MAILDHVLTFAAPLIRKMGRRRLIERKAQFALAPPAQGQIVFLGDSIIEQGLWDSWFPGLPTLNRGIGGELIADVQARLGSALQSPRAVVLMVGTNDVETAGKGGSVDISLLPWPVCAAHHGGRTPGSACDQQRLAENSALSGPHHCSQQAHPAHHAEEVQAAYVDLWPHMAGPDGAIRPELTTDGLHLTGEGYRVWAEVLRRHLEKL